MTTLLAMLLWLAGGCLALPVASAVLGGRR